MENLIRNIGGVALMVDPHSPCDIFFEEEFIEKNKINVDNISPSEICSIIASKKYLPLISTWELTDKCSFKCPFCFIVGHSNNGLVRFSQIKDEISTMIDTGLLFCTLSGGEPMLHPDFKEIYKLLKTSGVIVEVYSNGSLLDYETIELFKEFPPHRIEISVYGIDNNKFYKAVGNNHFEPTQILENIIKLKQAGINVECKTPINKLTLDEFSKVKKWAEVNEVVFSYSTEMFNAYDGESLQKYKVEFSVEVEFEALKILKNEGGCSSVTSESYKTGKTCYSCSIKSYGYHINSKFELMPCSISFLEETKSNILKVGIRSAIKKYRNFVEPFIGNTIIGCSSCEAKSICNMCPANAKVIKDELGKIDGFKVTEEHCITQREKYNKVVDYITQSPSDFQTIMP